MHISHSSSTSGDAGSPSPEEQRAIDLRYNPPENEIPGAIGLAVVLGRTDRAAVAISGAWVYSAGIALDIEVRLRSTDPANRGVLDDVLFAGRRHGNIDNALLLGVEYPDGRRASILAEHWFPGLDQPADQPNLVPGGGGGSGTSQHLTYWLSPLPPPGDLIVVAAWPALGIAETQTVIGADLIAAGVAGVVELWPWELPAEHQPPPPPPRPQVEPGSWFADLPE